MRVSRAQAEENRETVINVASRLFREHGFDGIGLKDLMKGRALHKVGSISSSRPRTILQPRRPGARWKALHADGRRRLRQVPIPSKQSWSSTSHPDILEKRVTVAL